MTHKFDAYYKWFGIRPEEQPPDHYRLLGIRPFEQDPDVISNAADQRMSHLRSLQTGPHAVESQRILNEVSKARVTLLDAERKLAYDVALRKKIAAAAAADRPGARRAADTSTSGLEPLGSLADEGELDFGDAPFESRASSAAAFPSTATMVRSGQRRGRSSPLAKLASVAFGLALGSVVVYAALGNFAGIDPLGIFPRRDGGAETTRDAADGNGESAVASKATRSGGPSESVQGGSDDRSSEAADSPGVGNSRIPPRDPRGTAANRAPPNGIERPSAAKPAGQHESPSADPFAGIPPHVALPAVSDTSPHVLARIGGASERMQELSLLADAAALEDGHTLELVAASTTDARRWEVRLRNAETVPSAAAAEDLAETLAEFTLDGTALTFRWQDSAAGIPVAAQVQNCLLKLRVAEIETVLRLRRSEVRPAHVLDFATAASLVEIPLDAAPKAESLMLEIGPAEALPWGSEFEDERSRVRFVTPTKEKVVVLLTAITDADRPELPIEPQATRKGLQLRIAPRLVSPKGESSLSLSAITDTRKRYSVLKIKTDKLWSELKEQQTALEKREKDLERRVRGGASAAARRELSLATAQLSQVNAAFKKVDADRMEVDSVLAALAPAEELIGELHKKGKIPYRVYATVAETEIDLVRALE